MNRKDRNDLLDSLLFAAAKDAGKNDIGEYNSENDKDMLPDSLAEKIYGIARRHDDTKVPKSFGLRRFVAVAAAAAVLVCGLTIAGIAGRKQRTASVEISDSASGLVLTYDTSGIRPDSEPSLPNVPKGYTFIDDNGIDSMRFGKNDIVFTCKVTRLAKDYNAIIGKDDNTEYFDFVVAGKYNGCVAVTTDDNGNTSSAVYWNDGETAYELYAKCTSDVLCNAAQALCE